MLLDTASIRRWFELRGCLWPNWLMVADAMQWCGTTSPVASSDRKFQVLDNDVWCDLTALTEMIMHRVVALSGGEVEPVRPRLVVDTIWGDFVDRVSRHLVGK